MLVLPSRKSSAIVEQERQEKYECPLCRASHTREEASVEWVDLLMGHRCVTICVGCCIDIFNTCRIEEYENHPYYEIVRQGAEYFGIPVEEFRRICLQDQLRIMEGDPVTYSGRSNQELKDRIERLLAEIR